MTEDHSDVPGAVANESGDRLALLAGGIAHDYNNLLTVILGNVELVQSQLQDERLKGLLREAALACRMGERMTRRLLTFAQQRHLLPVVLHVNGVITALCEALSGLLHARWRVHLQLAADLPPVSLDESEFEAALLNILFNALDAMATGGTLTIASRAAKVGATTSVQVVVSDTGTGMSPDVLARALEPFFTTKGPEKGAGLGLSTVKGFIAQSGGTIELRSDAATGTQVTMSFPAL